MNVKSSMHKIVLIIKIHESEVYEIGGNAGNADILQNTEQHGGKIDGTQAGDERGAEKQCFSPG